MISIIDYGVGNIKAFANIYYNAGISFKIATSVQDLEKNVSKIILPGVGSFDHAMQSLQRSGMRERLDELVVQDKLPVIGICVGMQMLAHFSEEGNAKGPGWIDAEVKKFDSSILGKKKPLPHMGWNNLNILSDDLIFNGLMEKPRFYFLHSYFFECFDNDNVLATANYGKNFACVVKSENVYGIQCHPEKSHHNGINLLNNFGRF